MKHQINAHIRIQIFIPPYAQMHYFLWINAQKYMHIYRLIILDKIILHLVNTQRVLYIDTLTYAS